MANLVTLARFPLLVGILVLLFWGGLLGRIVSVPLILILMLMDFLDGFLARRYKESSLLGSALDVATDRSVELVFWVVFSYLGLISLLIPLIVIVRGTITDAIRAVGSSRGVPPFDMMRTSIGQTLVKTPLMRSGYAIIKGFAFCTLAMALALQEVWGGMQVGTFFQTAWLVILRAGQVFSWVALAICLLRGVPVMVEAPAYFYTMENSSESDDRPISDDQD